MARTRFSSSGFTQKRLEGLFKKGYQDGAFNGWPGKWNLPAAPAAVCYFDGVDDQCYALMVYTVAFFMGAVDTEPRSPKVPGSLDVSYHNGIARVSEILLLEG